VKGPLETASRTDIDLREIRRAVDLVARRVLDEDMRGYDPYDALTSPLFRLPVLRSAHAPRFAAQQVLKRLPVNVRPLLLIGKGYNPVTVALMLQGWCHLADAAPADESRLRERAEDCVERLARMRSGSGGRAWGYDFDWETRYGPIPAHTPTVVATGIVSHALFVAYERFGLTAARDLCGGAVEFVTGDLPRVETGNGTFCWTYSPVDRQLVLNATMKGARLCAEVYSVTGEERLAQLALGTSRFVASAQRGDGSWPYAAEDARTWIDNFHTAYVLDCLDDVRRGIGSAADELAEVVDRGWRFYRANFFADGSLPKYFHDRLYPIDATACGQSLQTLCRFGDSETAVAAALRAVAELQRADGHFAYQRRRRYSIRIPYTRWSSAYMFAGLTRVLAEVRHA
jgi:hypothetical protein